MSLPEYTSKRFDIQSLAAHMCVKGHFLSLSGFLLTWMPFFLLIAGIVMLCKILSSVSLQRKTIWGCSNQHRNELHI